MVVAAAYFPLRKMHTIQRINTDEFPFTIFVTRYTFARARVFAKTILIIYILSFKQQTRSRAPKWKVTMHVHIFRKYDAAYRIYVCVCICVYIE